MGWPTVEVLLCSLTLLSELGRREHLVRYLPHPNGLAPDENIRVPGYGEKDTRTLFSPQDFYT